jgi:periplasmic divalent cation tolerance protein
MKFNLVYITTSDPAEAQKIGKAMVGEKLAACANIINGMDSVYRWEGKVEEGKEAILILKTKEKLVPELIEKVRSLHSYACPCIVSLPIVDGNKAYLDWLQKETR